MTFVQWLGVPIVLGSIVCLMIGNCHGWRMARMKFTRLVVIVAMLLSSFAANAGTIQRIANDLGGNVFEYRAKFSAWKEAGDTVVIDGLCASACTQVLAYQIRTCATSSGVFAFHSASMGGQYSMEGTAFMWFGLSPYVQNAIVSRGWDGVSKHEQPIPIPATEIVPLCK